MSYTLYGFLLAGSLFFGMLILIEVGRRIGIRRRAEDPEGARAGFGIIEGAVFALLGLLLAFTVSGAGARFDARRHLIVEETNAIGTAYLRLDMLPSAAQPGLRENFRRYVDARLEVYHHLGYGLRHSRPRVPAHRVDPRSRLRSSAGGASGDDEMKKL